MKDSGRSVLDLLGAMDEKTQLLFIQRTYLCMYDLEHLWVFSLSHVLTF